MKEINYEYLVEKAKNGNESAISQLYENTYKNAYFISVQIVKDEYEAQDILQECYIKAFQKLDTLKDPKKFPAWINRIVSNRSIDMYRRKKPLNFSDLNNKEDESNFKEIDFEDLDESSRPEIVADKKETARLLKEIIYSLSDEQRIVVTMYFFQRMKIKEIAYDLNISENTVKSRITYAKNKIEKEVLSLEKKGTKLYGLAPIPFLLLLMEKQSQAASINSTILGNIINGFTETIGKSSSSTGASTTTNAAPKASGLGSKLASMSIVKKTIVGALIAGVTVGGGTFAYNQLNGGNTQETSKIETNILEENEKNDVKVDLSNYKLEDYINVIPGEEGRPDIIELNIDTDEAKEINRMLNEKINNYYDISSHTPGGEGYFPEKIILWDLPDNEDDRLYFGLTGYSDNVIFNVRQNEYYEDIMTIKIDLYSRDDVDFYVMANNENLVYNLDKKTGKFLYLKDILKRENKTIDDVLNSGVYRSVDYGKNMNDQLFYEFEEGEVENYNYKFTGEEMFEIEKKNDYGNTATLIDIYIDIDKNKFISNSGHILSTSHLYYFSTDNIVEYSSDNIQLNLDTDYNSYLGEIIVDGVTYYWHGVNILVDENLESFDINSTFASSEISANIYDSISSMENSAFDERSLGKLTLAEHSYYKDRGATYEEIPIEDKLICNITFNNGKSYNNVELNLKK